MHIHLYDPLGPINNIFFKIILYCLNMFSVEANYPQLGAVITPYQMKKKKPQKFSTEEKDAEY